MTEGICRWSLTYLIKILKILLLCSGHISEQKANLMGLYLGLILARKNILIYNLINLLLFFVFATVKLVFWHNSYCARCEVSSKLARKAPEYEKLKELQNHIGKLLLCLPQK